MSLRSKPFPVAPVNINASSAIIDLLRVANAEDIFVSAAYICSITQSTPTEVVECLELLNAAGLLKVEGSISSETAIVFSGRSFTINYHYLELLFEGDVSTNGVIGSRLSAANAGNGEYSLNGWRGQDDRFLRSDYIRTKVSVGHDHQTSCITAKGRALWIVLELIELARKKIYDLQQALQDAQGLAELDRGESVDLEATLGKARDIVVEAEKRSS
jgi:hypothetical protein